MISNEVVNFAFEENLVRVVEIDGEPWFVGKDVCHVLGIRDHKQALERLDEDEKDAHIVDALADVSGYSTPPQMPRGGYTVPPPSPGTPSKRSDGGAQSTTIISEPGVFRLIFTSRKPEAERFKRWLAHEVLPALRKTGRFSLSGDAAEPMKLGEEPLAIVQCKLAILREGRIIHGLAYARHLWGELQMPAVPSQTLPPEEDGRRALAHLLSEHVRPELGTVREWIERALDGDENARIDLRHQGIRASQEISPEGFIVANTAAIAVLAFKGTPWDNGRWVYSLRVLPGASKSGTMKFADNRAARGIFIPAEHLAAPPPTA